MKVYATIRIPLPLLVSLSNVLNIISFLLFFDLQAERFVDRKLDQAESALKKKQRKAIKWYSSLIGDENGPKINDLHLFVGAFLGGVAIGIATS